jgi:hypothetical protein
LKPIKFILKHVLTLFLLLDDAYTKDDTLTASTVLLKNTVTASAGLARHLNGVIGSIRYERIIVQNKEGSSKSLWAKAGGERWIGMDGRNIYSFSL